MDMTAFLITAAVIFLWGVVSGRFQHAALTAPPVRPETMNFCKKRKRRTTGGAVSRTPAANGPQFSVA